MDFGIQSATRAADRTSFRPPYLPAACWGARTMVVLTMICSKLGSSAIAAHSESQTPSLDLREKRTKMLFKLPKLPIRSRHGTPVLASQRIASTNRQLLTSGRPGSVGLPGKLLADTLPLVAPQHKTNRHHPKLPEKNLELHFEPSRNLKCRGCLAARSHTPFCARRNFAQSSRRFQNN